MPYADPAAQQLPFASGSDTSHDAAVAARRFAGSQRERLLQFYVQRGRVGATDSEACAAVGLSRSSCCARRAGLMHDGLVVRLDGARRAGAFAGVRQSVWIAVTKED